MSYIDVEKVNKEINQDEWNRKLWCMITHTPYVKGKEIRVEEQVAQRRSTHDERTNPTT